MGWGWVVAIIKRSVLVEAPVQFVFEQCSALSAEMVFSKFGAGALVPSEGVRFGRLEWSAPAADSAMRLVIMLHPATSGVATEMIWQFDLTAPAANELREISIKFDLELRATREAIERSWAGRPSA